MRCPLGLKRAPLMDDALDDGGVAFDIIGIYDVERRDNDFAGVAETREDGLRQVARIALGKPFEQFCGLRWSRLDLRILLQ